MTKKQRELINDRLHEVSKELQRVEVSLIKNAGVPAYKVPTDNLWKLVCKVRKAVKAAD